VRSPAIVLARRRGKETSRATFELAGISSSARAEGLLVALRRERGSSDVQADFGDLYELLFEDIDFECATRAHITPQVTLGAANEHQSWKLTGAVAK
jgi:hypothetical protein